MDLSKIYENNPYERTGPIQNIIGADSNPQITYRKDDVVVILSQDAIKNATITVTSKPKNDKPSFLSSIINEFSSTLIRRVRSLFQAHGD